MLRAGDLVVLTGDLGAGKTTLTQGIGVGLDVRGQVGVADVRHREGAPAAGATVPALVHVDAYRLGSLDEVDALDLDASLDEAVTVVEWGEGWVEGLTTTAWRSRCSARAAGRWRTSTTRRRGSGSSR